MKLLRPTARQIAQINAQRDLFNYGQNNLAIAVNKSIEQMPENLRGHIEGNAYSIGRDEWKAVDTQAVELQREILVVYNDLASINKSVDIAFTAHEWNNVSDSGEVNISLDGRSMAKEDQATMDYHITPIPIIDSVAGFGWRQMKAIERGITSLDTSTIANKQRRVAEAMEDIAINGSDKISINGQKVYGLRTAPKRLTGQLNVAFRTSSGEDIRKAFVEMIQAFINNKHYGQVTVYMNYNDWFTLSERKYSTAYNSLTILQEIMTIAGIGGIVPAPKVPAGELLPIVKSSQVYQVLNGMPMTTIPLARHNVTDEYRTRVMAATSVEFKYDFNETAGYGQFTVNAS